MAGLPPRVPSDPGQGPVIPSANEGAEESKDGDASGWTPRSAEDDTCVRVCLRVRPFVPQETAQECRDCTRVTSPREICVGTNRRFTFDRVYGPEAPQKDLYNDYIIDLVDGCFRGFNATVFAYGQTGSGKTYTMGTGSQVSLLQEELGIVPRVLERVFSTVDSLAAAMRVRVSVSFLEIYRETVRDLLHPETNSKSIFIREATNGEIIVQGLEPEEALSAQAAFEMLEMGSLARSTGSTLMNVASSRSHAIFTLSIEQHTRGASHNECVSAKFHLIDLAGSERVKRTGAVGVRFKESVQINQGLLALGNVISALGNPRTRQRRVHVPYRDSKLTRLLQDSLGGNSRTVMIACVSPADSNFEETLSTLKYANRARKIKNRPVRNVRLEQASQIEALKEQVRALKSELDSQAGDRGVAGQSISSLLAELERLQAAVRSAEESGVMSAERLFTAQSDLATCLRSMSEVQAGLRELARSSTTHTNPAELVGILSSLARQLEPQVPTPTVEPPPKRPHHGAAGEADKSLLRRSIEDGSIWSDGRAVQGNALRGEGSGPAVTHADMEALRKRAEETEAENKIMATKLDNIVRALREAQDELNRDEEIFKTKLETIGDLHSRLTEAVDQNAVLKEAVSEADARVKSLERELAALRSGGVPGKHEGASVAADGDLGHGGASHRRQVSFGSVATGDSSEDDDAVLYKGPGELSVLTDASPGEAASLFGATNSNNGDAGQASVPRLAAELHELQQQLARAEEQKKVLEESVAKVEGDKASLEEELKRTERDHARARQALQGTLRELTLAIRQKEELIRTLIQSESEAAAAAQAFESRVQHLEAEVGKYRSTVSQVQAQLEEHDRALVASTQEAKEAQEALKRKYQAKLVRAKANLAEARRRQAEANQVEKERRHGEKRVEALESDLNRLRQEKAKLAKRLKREEHDENARLEALKRALSRVKREAELERKKGAELRAQNESQRRELRERSREAELAQRRLSVVKQQANSPARHRFGRSPSRARTPGSARGRRATAGAVRQAWHKVHDAINAAVASDAAGNRLRRSIAVRAKARDERAELLRLRATLVQKKTEAMGKLATRRAGVLQAARALDARINALANMEDEKEREDGAARSRELERLGVQRRQAVEEVRRMDEIIDADAFLAEDDATQLQEVQERLETVEAQIEYKTTDIEVQRRQSMASVLNGNGAEAGEEAKTPSRVRHRKVAKGVHDALAVAFKVPLNTARSVLHKALEALVAAEGRLRAQQQAGKVSEIRLAEKQAEADSLAIALRRAKIDFDRQLTTRQQRFEAKTTRLVRQLQETRLASVPLAVGNTQNVSGSGAPTASSDSLALPQVVKENKYYKAANRELRHHLRAAMKANENLKVEVRNRSAVSTTAQQENEALRKELSNIKAYLRRQKGQSSAPRTVRLSASALRELAPADVAARISHGSQSVATASSFEHHVDTPGSSPRRGSGQGERRQQQAGNQRSSRHRHGHGRSSSPPPPPPPT